jgi:hypothetical protein
MKKKVATCTQLSRRLSFLSILFHKLINAVGVIILLLLLVLVSRPRLLLHPHRVTPVCACNWDAGNQQVMALVCKMYEAQITSHPFLVVAAAATLLVSGLCVLQASSRSGVSCVLSSI